MICGDPPTVTKYVLILVFANHFATNDQITTLLKQILSQISTRFIKKGFSKNYSLILMAYHYIIISFLLF